MKRSLIILAFFIAAFLSCNDQPSIRTSYSDSIVVDIDPTDTSSTQTTDTIKQLYWEKLPIQTVADLILKDSIRPATSPVIYNMLDSLSSDAKQTRQYYLKVFNKIMNKADGDLAESIGSYALTYVQNYPKEFIESSRNFSRNQLEAWASNIGIEIFLASNESDNVKEAFDQIVILFNDNCKDCNSNHKSKLKEFTNLIWRTVQENQQAEKRQR